MSSMPNLYLLYHTIKPLKIKQVYSYATNILKSSILKKFIINRVKKKDFQDKPVAFQLMKKPYVYNRHDLARHAFVFLNKMVNFEEKLEWNNANLEKLWLYHLHYFDYLIKLTDEISQPNYLVAKSIVDDWISNNPIGHGNGWEPYPISKRVVNWMFFYQLYRKEFEENPQFEEKFLKSLYQQCHYLTYFIEYHIQANHLFENAKALCIAGLFFDNSKWLKKGSVLLTKEIKKQVLNDGGHFERSPMYHAIILEDILDLINFSKHFEGETNFLEKNLLHITAEKMFFWLASLVHPDGDIPLFGDSALNSALTLSQLQDYLKNLKDEFQTKIKMQKFVAFESSGYFTFKAEDQFLIIDAGQLGVLYQPGHGHCDLFSYEYSYSGYRFIIDTGVGNYLVSDMRQKARSIYAHNTVVVNNLDQAEIWRAFRMARRVKPENINYSVDSEEIRFEGYYINNLEKRKMYQHKRKVLFKNNRFFKIEDHIEGRAIKSVESLVHIHPAAKIKVENDLIYISRNNKSIGLLYDSERTKIKISEWIYVPEFGHIVDSNVISFMPKVDNNPILSYIICPLSQINQARKYYLDKIID